MLVAGEEKMIQAYTQGCDLHRQTASIVLGKPVEDISKDDNGKRELRNDLYTCWERFLGLPPGNDQGKSDWGGMVLTEDQLARRPGDRQNRRPRRRAGWPSVFAGRLGGFVLPEHWR